jgi:transposase
MIRLKEGMKIFVSAEPVDARKSIDGLTCLIPDRFNDNPQSGNLFLFFNKAKDKVKILCWDDIGFVLYYKRLEKHRFAVPKLIGHSHLEITEIQLQGLLGGLDFMLMRKFTELNYSKFI